MKNPLLFHFTRQIHVQSLLQSDGSDYTKVSLLLTSSKLL